MSDEREEEEMVLLLRTRRPSGDGGQLHLPVRTTTNGGVHLHTAQKIIRFLLSEIKKMDAEEGGVSLSPEAEAEFKSYKSPWPRKGDNE